MPRHRREPRGEDLGAGDSAEQHAVVPPAVRLPPQHHRVDVAHLTECSGRLGTQQCTAVPTEHVRDRLLAELFLHHVGDDVGEVVREVIEIQRELREPLLVRLERERIERLRQVPQPTPMMHGQPGARYDEYAPRRHQMPAPAMRSWTEPGTETIARKPGNSGPPRRCAVNRALDMTNTRRAVIRCRSR